MTEASYDPFAQAVMENPYPFYRWLRDEAPCYHNPQRDIYAISRYDDVRNALRDTERLSSNQGVGYERRPVPMMIAYDPPEHTRLRRIVAGRFTPRRIAQWSQRIEQLVTDTLDPLIGAGKVDLVSTLAAPFPVQVIAEMMDIPAERREDFKRWSDSTIEALGGAVDLSVDERMAVEERIEEFARYFHELIQQRKNEADVQGDDLISLLLRANEDGERLTDFELISFCVLLLVAGNETTTNLISNSVFNLIQAPGEWKKVVDDPTLLPSLVEECLRYDAPIQGFFRNATCDFEWHGVGIPKDAKVMLLYGSANRDERRYREPEKLRADRNPEDHLAFGWGPHRCLGAHLARLEATILARHCIQKVRRIELAATPERTRNPLLRGLESLPVVIEGR